MHSGSLECILQMLQIALNSLKPLTLQRKKRLINLSTTPRTPTKPMEVEAQIDRWESKFSGICSSPSRPEWHSFVKGTKQVLVRSELQEHELRIHQERRISE